MLIEAAFKVHRSKYFKPGHVSEFQSCFKPHVSILTDQLGFQSCVGGAERWAKIRQCIHIRANRCNWGGVDRGRAWTKGLFQYTTICHCCYWTWSLELRVSYFLHLFPLPYWSLVRPILTYGRQGLGKPGIHPEYHSIIYSTRDPPELDFTPYLVPVRFEGKNARHKLDICSLINYAKIYPVEHNVKVQFIGWIAADSQRNFVRDFDAVWNSHKRMGVKYSQG